MPGTRVNSAQAQDGPSDQSHGQHTSVVNTVYRSQASEVARGEAVEAAQAGYFLGPCDAPMIGIALLSFVYLLLV